MSVKDKRAATKTPADLSSREAVRRFREAAAEFTKQGTRSKGIGDEGAGRVGDLHGVR